jgi:hypothetical protein
MAAKEKGILVCVMEGRENNVNLVQSARENVKMRDRVGHYNVFEINYKRHVSTLLSTPNAIRSYGEDENSSIPSFKQT